MVYGFFSSQLLGAGRKGLKNNTIIKLNCTNHNYDPKCTENVHDVLIGLKRCVLTGVDQTIGQIYEEEVKRFVNILFFH